MAWCQPGYKPLSETMMVNLLTHICVTWHQWVKYASLLASGHTIRRLWTWSTLVQLMAGCLAVTSHYLIQCWCISKGALRHSPERNSRWSDPEINPPKELEIYKLISVAISPGRQWVDEIYPFITPRVYLSSGVNIWNDSVQAKCYSHILAIGHPNPRRGNRSRTGNLSPPNRHPLVISILSPVNVGMCPLYDFICSIDVRWERYKNDMFEWTLWHSTQNILPWYRKISFIPRWFGHATWNGRFVGSNTYRCDAEHNYVTRRTYVLVV